MQIAFGCFYQGMPKLPFRRRRRQPRRLRIFLRLLSLPQLQMAAVAAAVIATRAASTTGASDAGSVACPAVDQKRKAHP
jgi:Tfp pilus assembly protein PilN